MTDLIDMTTLAGGPAYIRSEPRTYTPESGHSWLLDNVRAAIHGNEGAIGRLARYERECEVDKREIRANPTTRVGQGGEFAPPLWAIDQFGTSAVAGRVAADLIPTLPLPPGRSSIHIPRMSTGGTEAVQQEAGADPGGDEVTADANCTVVTISGEVNVSQQLLDLTPPGYDAIAYVDLSRQYNRALDDQIINGTGSNGQMTGLVNVNTTGNHVIAGGSLTSVATFWPGIGQCAAAVSNDRKLPMEHWLWAPRRWDWFASSVDNSNRPVASPGVAPRPVSELMTPAGGTYPAGTALGHPVWQAGAIAAGSSNDLVVAFRPSDCLLYESAPKFMVTAQPTSGTLQVKIRLYHYVAAVLNRYPTGIAVITGLTQPSNF